MGLLYVFPVSHEEKDFVEIKEGAIILKTYGLPYLFWGYALSILMVIIFMFLAIKEPILKLIALGDETDSMLGYALLGFLSLLPVFLFAFFFYEKRIIKQDQKITMEYRIFGIKVFSESFKPKMQSSLEVLPYLSSPNLARLKGNDEERGFQNKGYYILWLFTDDNRRIILDRHSRKVDLDKLAELIQTSL